MADNGSFFQDTREPHVVGGTVPAAVTLADTDKALYTTSSFPFLGGQYFARAGKKIRIRLTGIMTSAATPGNGSFAIYYGSGADATGVLLVQGAAVALTANQANMMWIAEFTIECITIGNAGTLRATGWAMFNEAIQAAHMLIPATVGAVSGACDLTAANIISVQYKRSGSTAETMQVLSMDVTAMN